MFKQSLFGIAVFGALAGCDVTYPVAVVGPSDTVYRGQATALAFDGGFFQASNGANFCTGQYLPAVAGETTTFPVKCSNGLTGIGTAVFETGQSGGGTITMRDGTSWRFIFGRGALLL